MATDERRRRYRKPGIKSNVVKYRASNKDLDMIDYLSYETGMSKSDIIRRGILMQYNLMMYKR